MPDDKGSLIEGLKKDQEKMMVFMREMPEYWWDRQVYSEGAAWSVRDIMTHINEAERSIPYLIRQVLEGGEGVPEDFDLNRYNESKVKKMAGLKNQELMEMFDKQRGETILMVEGMSEAELDHEGRHPFLGKTQARAMIRMMVIHTHRHRQEIKRELEAAEV